MRIISVDDSKAVHAYLTEIFDGTGITLEHYFDGKEVIDAISQNLIKEPDVILLDWEMPVKSGIETLPILREKFPNTLIIMATSKNSMTDIVSAIEKGASDYVMKPFTKDILFDKIQQLLGKRVA